MLARDAVAPPLGMAIGYDSWSGWHVGVVCMYQSSACLKRLM